MAVLLGTGTHSLVDAFKPCPKPSSSMAGPLRSRKILCYIFFILCAHSLYSDRSFSLLVQFISFFLTSYTQPLGLSPSLLRNGNNVHESSMIEFQKKKRKPLTESTHRPSSNQRSIEFNQVHSCLRFAWRPVPTITRWWPTMHADLLIFFFILAFYSQKFCLVALYINRGNSMKFTKEWRWKKKELLLLPQGIFSFLDSFFLFLKIWIELRQLDARALFRLHVRKSDRGRWRRKWWKKKKKVSKVWSISSRLLSSD